MRARWSAATASSAACAASRWQIRISRVPRARAPSTIMNRAAALFPALRHAYAIRFWSGTEGEMADRNPVIGFSRTTPNLIHAFGFSGAGFQIAPGVGEVLAELVRDGESRTPIDAFAIDRFARTTTARRADTGPEPQQRETSQ